jgi:tetratricopeptide (TPR) repeat protein
MPAIEEGIAVRRPSVILLALLAGCSGHQDAFSNAPPSLHTGQVALDVGQPAIAVSVAETQLQLNPGNTDALLLRASGQAALGQVAQAAAGFRQVLAADPGSATAALGLSRLMTQSDPATVEGVLGTVVARGNATAAIWNNLGVARDLLNHHAAAQDAYRKALAADPGMQGAQVNLARSLTLGPDDPVQPLDLAQQTPVAQAPIALATPAPSPIGAPSPVPSEPTPAPVAVVPPPTAGVAEPAPPPIPATVAAVPPAAPAPAAAPAVAIATPAPMMASVPVMPAPAAPVPVMAAPVPVTMAPASAVLRPATPPTAPAPQNCAAPAADTGSDSSGSLGRWINGLNQQQTTLRVAEAALQCAPSDLSARRAAVYAAISAGEYGRAQALSAEAVRLAPDDARSYVMSADSDRARGDYANALSNLRKAKALLQSAEPKRDVP